MTGRYIQIVPSAIDIDGAMTGFSSVAALMSVTTKRTTSARDIFKSEILEVDTVCSHCFKEIVEVVEAKKIIREERDYRVFGDSEKCYLRVNPLNDDPIEIQIPLEDRVDEGFCDCGQEIRAEGWEKTRSKADAVEHARNAAEVLEERGYEVEVDVLVQEVRRAKTSGEKEDRHLRGFEIFQHAVAKAIRD